MAPAQSPATAATSRSVANPQPRCATCNKCQGTLLRCSRCLVVHYCSKDHQAAHFSQHKKQCAAVKKAHTDFDIEERKLRDLPDDDPFCPPDPLTNAVGHFWGVIETRDYMRARFAYVQQLQTIHTHDSVVQQYTHLRDMLRLCRGDNMGVRDVIPGLMLRLDMDQECYDFIKWWRTTGEDGQYNWGDTDLPYLNLVNENVMEQPTFFGDERAPLSFAVPLMLLKIKLFIDFKNLEKARVEHDAKIPNEIMSMILQNVVRSPILRDNPKLYKDQDYQLSIQTLKKHIKQLYGNVNGSNKFFWEELLRKRNRRPLPNMYSPGNKQEAELIFLYSIDAFADTAGAIDIVRALKDGSF